MSIEGLVPPRPGELCVGLTYVATRRPPEDVNYIGMGWYEGLEPVLAGLPVVLVPGFYSFPCGQDSTAAER